MVDIICTHGCCGSVFDAVDWRKSGRKMMNKYWKKLCTPEQNRRQIGALTVLAVGLTALLIAYLLGAF